MSAALWDKVPMLRRLPIIATTASGLLYSILNPEVIGFVHSAQIVLISFVIGLGFYFSVWIQSK